MRRIIEENKMKRFCIICLILLLSPAAFVFAQTGSLELADSPLLELLMSDGEETPPYAVAEPDSFEDHDDHVPEITAVAITDDDFEDEFTEEIPPVPAPSVVASPVQAPAPEVRPVPAPPAPPAPEARPAPPVSPAAPQPPVRTQISTGESSAQQPEWIVVQTGPDVPTPPPPPPPPPPPAPSSPPQPTAIQVEPGSQAVSVRVIVNINGQEHVVEMPGAEMIFQPQGVVIPPPASAPSVPVSTPAPMLPSVAPLTSGPSAKIIPQLPNPAGSGIYRVQVGAFRNPVFAQGAYDRLKTAGFSPAFEQHGELYRVVIPGIKASEMVQVAQRLGTAGFAEAWARQEN